MSQPTLASLFAGGFGARKYPFVFTWEGGFVWLLVCLVFYPPGCCFLEGFLLRNCGKHKYLVAFCFCLFFFWIDTTLTVCRQNCALNIHGNTFFGCVYYLLHGVWSFVLALEGKRLGELESCRLPYRSVWRRKGE
ncbi:hypothetical protein B0T25DRAFT_534495 [Lasiosphaeria hispida]|uniref:Uncharacterized protein n=1 Tax=Lasiosphaeria hispida TaxID=260671 RepID=A0AAJ0HRE3_9PEZI|nr:hypothetical protein B0T25DRAFT_534495 [Lasiosphaeria hispida]